jgi:FkbM family methyltransferase
MIKIKKQIQKIFNIFGFSIIKKKNFYKLYRTLDIAIKILVNKKKPIIFDIGAHTGETIIRFRKLYKNCIIHSFEPQINSYKILKSLEDEKTRVNNFALGKKIEKKNFYIHNNDSTSSFYKFSKKNCLEKNNKVEEVQVRTLDEYVEKNDINFIDILKIDVQGYESEVLQGAINTLKNKVKIIELEIIFIDYYEKKSAFNEIEKILTPFRFDLYTISSPVINESNQKLKWLDAIYVKNGH